MREGGGEELLAGETGRGRLQRRRVREQRVLGAAQQTATLLRLHVPQVRLQTPGLDDRQRLARVLS